MADVTLTYKGSDILELSDSGSATLKTGGKYCEDDIEVEYVKPSGGDVSIYEITLANAVSSFANLIATVAPNRKINEVIAVNLLSSNNVSEYNKIGAGIVTRFEIGALETEKELALWCRGRDGAWANTSSGSGIASTGDVYRVFRATF